LILRRQPAPRQYADGRGQGRFLHGFDALSHHRNVDPPVVQQRAEAQPRHRGRDARDVGNRRLDLLGCADAMLFRRTRSRGEILRARDLQMPGLRADQRFTELKIQIANEAAAEDQRRNPKGDCGKGHRRPGALPQQVAAGQREQNRRRASCLQRPLRSASTMVVRDAFHAG
jgi:hypothetical protein